MTYFEYKYDNSNPTCAHAYLIKPLLSILNKGKNKKILDIGCGNGYIVRLLLEKGYDAFGIDASESGISISKKHYPDRFFLQDINSQSLPKELDHINFDTIISTEVIEHLYDPKGYIDFCKNILLRNGGGVIIISTPYHGYLKNLLIALSNKWDTHHTVLWDGGHIKFWSKKTLTKLLLDNEFTNIKFYGCGRLPYLWKSMILTGELKSKI